MGMTIKHPGALPVGAIPMSEALRRFVPDELWSRHEQAVRDQKDISKRRAAPRIRGAGAEASRVTREHQWDADDFERACYSAMMEAFVARLTAGELTAIAQRDPPFGEWQPIAWHRLRIENVRFGRVVGVNIELWHVHIVEGDCTRFLEPIKTGGPGRQSSKHLVIAELEQWIKLGKLTQWIDSGEVDDTIKAVAKRLGAWLEVTYPKAPPLAQTSMENVIRTKFNKFKKDRKTRLGHFI
jgi:hypothetical protein